MHMYLHSHTWTRVYIYTYIHIICTLCSSICDTMFWLLENFPHDTSHTSSSSRLVSMATTACASSTAEDASFSLGPSRRSLEARDSTLFSTFSTSWYFPSLSSFTPGRRSPTSFSRALRKKMTQSLILLSCQYHLFCWMRIHLMNFLHYQFCAHGIFKLNLYKVLALWHYNYIDILFSILYMIYIYRIPRKFYQEKIIVNFFSPAFIGEMLCPTVFWGFIFFCSVLVIAYDCIYRRYGNLYCIGKHLSMNTSVFQS